MEERFHLEWERRRHPSEDGYDRSMLSACVKQDMDGEN